MSDPRVRVMRVIARLNIGGPAIQAITLTQRLDALGYDTTLVRGSESASEGTMDHLAAEQGVHPIRVAALRRDPGLHDLVALIGLMRIIRRERPQIVHTHSAKAGTLGRVAALLVPARRRPVLVHTFHGHSLSGYFDSRRQRAFLTIERTLAKRTHRLIAVSAEVRDELVALGVARPERFEVIDLGFDLTPFQVTDQERRRRRVQLRAELGIPDDAHVVTLIARLVAIKRVDRFLRLAGVLSDRDDVRLLVVGDGDLRDRLRASEEAVQLGSQLVWTGFRHDIPAVCFASDVVVLTSDNEGTPVSLIEAQAAGTPVVSTRVGGVATVVRDGVTGFVVDTGDESAFVRAVSQILDDPPLGARLGRAGSQHAQRFALDALVARIDGLYRRLLSERELAAVPQATSGNHRT
jgi:glycosyltransferase involved in cell wall biosynthesis